MTKKIFTLTLFLSVIAFVSHGQTTNCCYTPIQPYETNVMTHSATLNWYYATPTNCPNPSKFKIRYKPINTAVWTMAQKPYVANGNQAKTIMNLNSNSGYIWQVRTVCPDPNGTLSMSPWTAQNDFMTTQKLSSLDIAPVISLYPNPGSQLNVMIENMSAETVTLQIVNVLGATVVSHTWNHVNDLLMDQVDVSSLPSGNYFAMVSWNGQKQVMKWVKD